MRPLLGSLDSDELIVKATLENDVSFFILGGREAKLIVGSSAERLLSTPLPRMTSRPSRVSSRAFHSDRPRGRLPSTFTLLGVSEMSLSEMLPLSDFADVASSAGEISDKGEGLHAAKHIYSDKRFGQAFSSSFRHPS